VGFNPRQLQPSWVESGLAQRLQRLGGLPGAEYLQRLDQDPGEAEQLLEQWLEPAAWSGPDATVVLRAPTRTLLDGLLRQRPEGAALVIWVLAPGCESILDHLRLRLQSGGHSPRLLQAQGPWETSAPNRGRMRRLLDWLQQVVPEAPTSGSGSGSTDTASAPTEQVGADLILVPDLFTHWRPDLQRQWLARLAAALRPGGLLLQGRPKALWRAPRGLRAVHLDGLHWLQRTSVRSSAPNDGAADGSPTPLPPANVAAPRHGSGGQADPVAAAAAPPASAGQSSPAATGTMETGVLLIDLDRLQLSLTQTARRLLGLPGGQTSLTWQGLLEHLGGTERERLDQALRDSLTGDTAPWTLDLLAPGTPRPQPLRLQAQPCVLNPADRPDGSGSARLLACTLQSQPLLDPNRLLVVTHLPGAADRQELELQYQPVFQVAGGQLQAIEALVRWRHPELGLVPPRSFIPWAEECGLIDELGRWVLRQACRQSARWRALGLPRVPMAVNLSERQLRQPNFSAQVAQALAESGLPGNALQLELPEADLDRLGEAGVKQLAACRRLGVALALDDFSGGPGRWQQVQQLPLDSLKLDPRCTHSLSGAGAGREIVQSTVDLAHQLGLQVVAEGVEDADQLDALRRIGCDAFQGHHVAAAQAPTGLVDWLHG
jgi:EAL domain-containing protein (putative c-di-GMP-specific phosphodiesterase class I)